MSKLYSRPRTPPSPPPFSQKASSSRSSLHGTKSYSSDHSKLFPATTSSTSRDYAKYSSYDKYNRTKYDKSTKYDRYDKVDRPSYKSSSYSLPTKEYNQDYSSDSVKPSNHLLGDYNSGSKQTSSFSDDPYKSKRSLYSDSGYNDRDSYLGPSKYHHPSSSDKYSSSKYASSPTRKSITDSKYSNHDRLNLPSSSGSGDKKCIFHTSKTMNFSKYDSGSNSYFSKNETSSSFEPYDSFRRGGGGQSHSGRGKLRDVESRGDYNDGPLRSAAGKSRSNDSLDSYGGGYQRYVIGDSVVYGSPGHYPKDIYPPSPKSKRGHSPHSSLPLASSSSKVGSSKPYSRYSSSPKRYSGPSAKGGPSRNESSYSRSSNNCSVFRKPPSPSSNSYQVIGSQNHSRNDRTSRNYTPPPDRDKSFSYDVNKSGRYYRERNLHQPNLKSQGSNASYRDKEDTYMKPYSTYQGGSMRGGGAFGDNLSREKYPSERHLRPLMPPKPLLSIPLSVNNLPKESRALLRQTLGLPSHRPLNGLDKTGRARRLEGRIGARKRAPLSPKDRRRRRPDDLRLWIESRKTEGSKPNSGTAAGNKAKGLSKRPLRAADTGNNRSRLMDSRRRILNKGKKKGTTLRREVRRPLLPKTRSRDEGSGSKLHPSGKTTTTTSRDSNTTTRNREGGGSGSGTKKRKEAPKTDRGRGEASKSTGSGGGTSLKASTSASSAKRPLKRPKNASQASLLPQKQRSTKRSSTFLRSSQDRDKGSKNDKGRNHSTKPKAKDRSRSRSKSRTGPSSSATAGAVGASSSEQNSQSKRSQSPRRDKDHRHVSSPSRH